MSSSNVNQIRIVAVVKVLGQLSGIPSHGTTTVELLILLSNYKSTHNDTPD